MLDGVRSQSGRQSGRTVFSICARTFGAIRYSAVFRVSVHLVQLSIAKYLASSRATKKLKISRFRHFGRIRNSFRLFVLRVVSLSLMLSVTSAVSPAVAACALAASLIFWPPPS